MGATLADEFFRNPAPGMCRFALSTPTRKRWGRRSTACPSITRDARTVALLKRMKVQGDHRCLAGSTVECKQRIYERYRRTGCTVKIYDYPSEGEENIPTKRVLARFRIEDPLFRDTIEVENPETKAFYAGKTVLVCRRQQVHRLGRLARCAALHQNWRFSGLFEEQRLRRATGS